MYIVRDYSSGLTVYISSYSCSSGHVLPVLGTVPRPAPALRLRSPVDTLLHCQRVALLRGGLLLLLLVHRQPRPLQHHVSQLPQRLLRHVLRSPGPRVPLQLPRELRRGTLAAHSHLAQSEQGHSYKHTCLAYQATLYPTHRFYTICL